MARPLRTNVPGGWYHVTARGQNRQPIYLDVADGANFMDRVAEFPSRFGVEVHAFVLMPNHYHLLLRTPRSNLSRAVQWLNTGYGIWWNRRHQQAGHVFQGRFKSILVEEGAWLLELSLYLHLNPVALKRLDYDREQRRRERLGAIVPPPEVVAQRLDILRSWRWSSYRVFAGLQDPPDWLSVSAILSRVEGGMEGYRALAESRVGAASPSPWAHVRGSIVLGGDAFCEEALRLVRPAREHAKEAPLDRAPWDRIVAWVEQRRGKPWSEMMIRRGEWGRDLAWWAGRRYGELTLKQLGELAGGVDYAAVAKALERFTRALDEPERAAAARDIGAFLRHQS